MPVSKDDPKSVPEADPGEAPEEEEKVVPAKGDPGFETPSGYALSKVGADGDGDAYKKAKAQKRWGVG